MNHRRSDLEWMEIGKKLADFRDRSKIIKEIIEKRFTRKYIETTRLFNFYDGIKNIECLMKCIDKLFRIFVKDDRIQDLPVDFVIKYAHMNPRYERREYPVFKLKRGKCKPLSVGETEKLFILSFTNDLSKFLKEIYLDQLIEEMQRKDQIHIIKYIYVFFQRILMCEEKLAQL